ncbi:uncharacterized protein [Asterias amurensis]|uniref:uncharacterized protein n=1 Tax=Asterias amurensis TaxID=7602 RepID=UPI003AB46BA5
MDGEEDTTLQGRNAELNSNNNADAEKINEKSTDSSSADEETAGSEEEAAAGDHDNVVGLEKVDATGEDDVKSSTTGNAASKSLADKQFNALFDSLQERANGELAHEQIAEEQEESDEELQDAGNMDDPQHHNIHCDLVTPELSAEDQQKPSSPPKLSHKKQYKKRSPKTDHNKKRSRKLEYQSPVQDVSLHKAIKRKLLPKSNPKVKKQRVNKKKQLQERNIQEDGTWVQCMHSECMKWRYLRDVTDPSLIPEYWVCEKNSDPVYNSCDKSEEDWHYLEFVFTKFTEGSIVWAKMQGYPWWPAMVEEDPDTGTYCEQQDTESYPTQFHVVFLDKNVSRTWLKTSSVRNFEAEENIQTQAKGKSFKNQLSHAVARAKKALSMNIQDRIKTFGFSHTFKGKIVEDSQDTVEGSDKDDSDDETKDEDVELDLEMLGVDVDEILEQAEALLSEAGETIHSLQDTSTTDDFPEKEKRGRKRKKAESESDKKDQKKKKVRSHKEKEKGVKKNKADKKEKKHKSHHHHSKKDKKMAVKEDPQSVTTKKDENQTGDKTTQDIKSNEVNDKEAEPETQNKETKEGNLSPKKTKKRQYKKKATAQVGDQDPNHLSTDGEKGETEGEASSARSKKDEKKIKKQNVKKNQTLESDPNHQKNDTEGEVVQEAVKVKAKKVKEPKVKTSDSETKIKKPRVRKVVAPKQKPEKSTVNLEVASDGKKHIASKDATSTPKAKKRSKKDEAAPKMKPTFKPPSKPKKDILKEMKNAPFQAPLMKAEPSLEKEHKEDILKDVADDNKIVQDGEFNATANDQNSPGNTKTENKPQVQDQSKKSGENDAVKTKEKASKFSIKKKNPTNENSSPVTSIEPTKNSATSSSITEEKSKKLKKKAPPKKFSIKQKPVESANLPSLTPVQQITDESAKIEESDEGRSKPSAEKLDVEKQGLLQKAAPKKFSIKRKEAPADANKKVKNEDSPKVAESRHQEEQSQGVEDDNVLHLDIDEDSLSKDVAMAIEKLEKEVDGDSDDFSMDDLTDWPKDPDPKDEVVEDNPVKLPKLVDGNDVNSQPFVIVEE